MAHAKRKREREKNVEGGEPTPTTVESPVDGVVRASFARAE